MKHTTFLDDYRLAKLLENCLSIANGRDSISFPTKRPFLNLIPNHGRKKGFLFCWQLNDARNCRRGNCLARFIAVTGSISRDSQANISYFFPLVLFAHRILAQVRIVCEAFPSLFRTHHGAKQERK